MKSSLFFYNSKALELSFDSYMVSNSELVKPDLRLLKTNNPLILPQGVPIGLIITSEDVLHS